MSADLERLDFAAIAPRMLATVAYAAPEADEEPTESVAT